MVEAGGESVAVAAVVLLLAAVSFSWLQRRSIMKKKKNNNNNKEEEQASKPSSPGRARRSILDQMSQTERLRLQSRIANSNCSEDLYSIFDDFSVLHELILDTETEEGSSEAHFTARADQAFRDLVRDKVNINDESVSITVEHCSRPKLFQQFFHEKILGIVRQQIKDSRELAKSQQHLGTRESSIETETKLDESRLATHICCHLARTRAGGDTFFSLSEIFNSPQLVITVGHTDTHPPTDLHTSDDGWAFITTTSNFDVYLAKDLHADSERSAHAGMAESDLGQNACIPLATLSARLEEAIPVTAEAQLERINFMKSLPNDQKAAQTWSASPVMSSTPEPFYRKLSIVCFDPCDPSMFRGGGGGKTVGVSVQRRSPIASAVDRSRQNTTKSDQSSESNQTFGKYGHPNDHVYRRKGLLRASRVNSNRPMDSVDIYTSTSSPVESFNE